MGDASRVGIEKGGKYARYKIIAASFPDARRVAPISACVSSSTKRYRQALPLNATTNGGDASRVGEFFSSLVPASE